MLHKVFLQTQFGSPHPWTREYFDHFQRLAATGWSMKVFTPNDWKSEGNIEIVPMTIHEFDGLIEKHCGVKVGNFIHGGAPHKVVSDYYPAYGQIFQDFIPRADYWGFTNWDMVYGRLSAFIPDELLEGCDIWADDVDAINGIFTLMHNDRDINNLFREVPNWQASFTSHEPTGFDEHQMTRTVCRLAADGEVRFLFPRPFPYHSYDRLSQHMPAPRLELRDDGTLLEKFQDVMLPNKEVGREIMSFHFSRTKRWPFSSRGGL